MEQFPDRVVYGNKIFRRLNSYWNGLWRSTKGKPNTDSVELSLLGPILPYLMVTQLDKVNKRLCFSYFGGTLCNRFGTDIGTGFLDESTSEEIRADIIPHLESVLATGHPTIMAADMKNPNVPFRHYECFTLPVPGSCDTAPSLITAITYAPCKHSARQAG